MSDDDFDLVVLGGGSGGLAGAQRAARFGAKVALLEPGPMGGTCVHVGCVPKKATWFASELAEAQSLAAGYGFDVHPGALDWPHFVASRRAYSDNSRASYERRLQTAGITVIREYGRFDGAHRIVAGERALRVSQVLIATGSRPRRADFAGGELGLDSDGFFALEQPPRHLAIVGGGYIAVELASSLRALGSEVCIFARGADLLSRDMDAEVAGVLREHLAAQGVRSTMSAEVIGAERSGEGYALTCIGGKQHGGYDQLLWAIGRVPNSHDLGLASVGVEVDARGAIRVDAQHRTSGVDIHAVGDVTSDPAFTPYAVRTARAVAERLFGGKPEAQYAPEVYPTVAFSHPPVGAIGMSESQARERYAEAVTCHVARFVPMRLRLAGVKRETILKLVCVGDEERIVGLHLCGDAAEEMLQGFAVAVTMGATKAHFNATLAIHPTSAEEFVLMA